MKLKENHLSINTVSTELPSAYTNLGTCENEPDNYEDYSDIPPKSLSKKKVQSSLWYFNREFHAGT